MKGDRPGDGRGINSDLVVCFVDFLFEDRGRGRVPVFKQREGSNSGVSEVSHPSIVDQFW